MSKLFKIKPNPEVQFLAVVALSLPAIVGCGYIVSLLVRTIF
jgi:hypothetical protein